MLLHKIESCLHQCTSKFGTSVAIEAIEIILVVRYQSCFDRIEAEAELRPPSQAAMCKLLHQRENCPNGSAIFLSQLCNIFVHSQNASGRAKPIRLRSSRGSVSLAGA